MELGSFNIDELANIPLLKLNNGRAGGGQMNKLKILEQWKTASEALDKASEHLLKFGMSIESETVSAVHEAMDEVTKLASVAVGDAFDWLSWYQHDNKMGALGLQATADGETREIRTLEDLLWSMDCGAEETPS